MAFIDWLVSRVQAEKAPQAPQGKNVLTIPNEQLNIETEKSTGQAASVPQSMSESGKNATTVNPQVLTQNTENGQNGSNVSAKEGENAVLPSGVADNLSNNGEGLNGAGSAAQEAQTTTPQQSAQDGQATPQTTVQPTPDIPQDVMQTIAGMGITPETLQNAYRDFDKDRDGVLRKLYEATVKKPDYDKKREVRNMGLASLGDSIKLLGELFGSSQGAYVTKRNPATDSTVNAAYKRNQDLFNKYQQNLTKYNQELREMMAKDLTNFGSNQQHLQQRINEAIKHRENLIEKQKEFKQTQEYRYTQLAQQKQIADDRLAETSTHNRATEKETERHHRATIGLGYSNLGERKRHNVKTEEQGDARIAETERSHRAQEALSKERNAIQWDRNAIQWEKVKQAGGGGGGKKGGGGSSGSGSGTGGGSSSSDSGKKDGGMQKMSGYVRTLPDGITEYKFAARPGDLLAQPDDDLGLARVVEAKDETTMAQTALTDLSFLEEYPNYAGLERSNLPDSLKRVIAFDYAQWKYDSEPLSTTNPEYAPSSIGAYLGQMLTPEAQTTDVKKKWENRKEKS
jgi:hypothetical protein